eukprot:gnl/MRDRNA2_/MRDRNA2_28379_c0_seq1.p1 gnl/MRDRNA2_/MRDRNA2_28379_c0~~gnl/MRDRNA2_/MRDRNA2_28379_c0_seq1.p1  ORF type:complete len:1470 (+),score=275.82 gnl/MRDRNA2_/MRDRNA2_28379_c0_seq1:176-4585(+)
MQQSTSRLAQTAPSGGSKGTSASMSTFRNRARKATAINALTHRRGSSGGAFRANTPSNPAEQVTDLVAALPLFSGCSYEFATELGRYVDFRRFSAGERIIEEGKSFHALGVVQRGRIECQVQGRKCGELRGGGYFGELLLLELQKQAYTSILCLGGELMTSPSGASGAARPDSEDAISATIAFVTRKALWEVAESFPSDREKIQRRRDELETAHRLLSSVPLFIACHQELMWILSCKMRQRSLNKHEAVITQGEELSELLIIEEGEIVAEVEGESEDGESALTCHVTQFGKGSWTGDVALLGVREPSPNTLRASQETILWSIDDSSLWTQLETFPRERKRFADHRDALAKLHEPDDAGHLDLVSLSCFHGFNRTFVESLDDVSERKLVLPETRVIKEGDEADCLILVESGVLALEINDQQIREVGDGDYVGEMVLIGSGKKSKWSATTHTHCALRFLHQTALQQVLLQYPEEKARLKAMQDKHSVARRGNDLQSLRNIHVFEDVALKFLSSLESFLEERLYWPDQVIVEEGSESTSLFIIHSGQAIITVKEKEIGRLSEGTVFRELAVLGVERRATKGLAAGSEVVVCSVLHRPVLRAVCHEFPDERTRLDGVSHDDLETRPVHEWPVFSGMNDALLECLEARLERRVFLKGQFLADVPVGGHWPSVLSIVRGQAVVSLDGHDVQILGPGGIYGEICALGVPVGRRERLQAKQICDVQLITREVLLATLIAFPEEAAVFTACAPSYLEDQQGGEEISALYNARLFQGCSEEFVNCLENRLEDRLYLPGQPLAEEGYETVSMALVRSGRVALSVCGEQVATLDAGDVFNEVAILGLSMRQTVTVTAMENAVLVRWLHSKALEDALQQFPAEKHTHPLEDLLTLSRDRRWRSAEELVKGQPFLAQGSSSFLNTLVEGMEDRIYYPGDSMLNSAGGVLVLVTGEASMDIGGVWVGNLGPGELFGELPTLGLSRFPLTARCIGDGPCYCILLHRHVVEGALIRFPKERARFSDLFGERHAAMKDRKAWVSRTSVELQHGVPFFMGCGRSFLKKILAPLREMIYNDGDVLAEERGDVDAVLILLRGDAQLFVHGIPLGILKGCAVFGELAALGLFNKYTASLRAIGEVSLLKLTVPEFHSLLTAQGCEDERAAFEALRSQKLQAARSLEAVRGFASLAKDNAKCLQAIALHCSEHKFLGLDGREVWSPNDSLSLTIVSSGVAAVELTGPHFEDGPEGFRRVAELRPGYAVADALLLKYGAVLVAVGEDTTLLGIRRPDLLSAVCHFTSARKWFEKFRWEQNSWHAALEAKIAARRAQAMARVPSHKMHSINEWAEKLRIRRNKSEKSKLLAQSRLLTGQLGTGAHDNKKMADQKFAGLKAYTDNLGSTFSQQRKEADLQTEILRTLAKKITHEEETYGATMTMRALLSWDSGRNSRANSRCCTANTSNASLPPLSRVATAPTELMKPGRITRCL